VKYLPLVIACAGAFAFMLLMFRRVRNARASSLDPLPPYTLALADAHPIDFCPRCGHVLNPRPAGSQFLSSRHAGLAMALLTRQHKCPNCGPIRLTDYPDSTRSTVRRLLNEAAFGLATGFGYAIIAWIKGWFPFDLP